LDERLLNLLVVDVFSAERMSCVLWNAIPGDWKEPDGGWISRSRNAVYKPGPSWCSMTFRLALCATWTDFWMRQSSSASAFGRISRRSAYPFSMDGSFGRSIIFFRRLALKVRVKGEDANVLTPSKLSQGVERLVVA
jgi:hypothetical protein